MGWCTEGSLQSNDDMRNRSVLIVEDDRVEREALTLLLKRLGYQTSPVGSVAAGLARLDGQDCAILDMDLPDGLGTHVLGADPNRRATDSRRDLHRKH